MKISTAKVIYLSRAIWAAEQMDWTQVILNGGPPCFALVEGDGRFCGRAKRWDGHDEHHKFVSLADMLKRLAPKDPKR